jgi:recombination protein RecA
MQSIVAQLRERIGGMCPDRGSFASGTIIDELLPHGSFRRGAIVELFGSGTMLATVLARMALRPGGALAVIDPARRFYPPAAASIGIDLNRLIVVQPDELDWVVTQALACPAIDAVLCWPDQLGAKTFRRWQLAAERGSSVGLVVRPSTARGSPSWADVQLAVTTIAIDRWRLEVVGRYLEFSIDERGHIHDCLRLVSELADPAPAARAARA